MLDKAHAFHAMGSNRELKMNITSESKTMPLFSESPRRLLTREARIRLAYMIGAIVILPFVFSFFDERYATLNNFGSLMRQASVLLLVASAASAPILMGTIDLSIGAMVSLNAVVAGLFAQSFGQIAVFLALPIGFACGIVNGLIISTFRLPSFLVTLGTSFAFSGLALALSGGFPVTLAPGNLYGLFNGTINVWFPVSIIWAIVVWGITVVVLGRTAFGRFVYMIGGNERACLANGVRVGLIKTLTFGLGGLLTSLAGILVLFQASSATADIGSSYLLTAIAAVVIGGTPLSGGEGGVGRTIIGTIILVELVQGMFIVGMSSAIQQIIEGTVVVLAMLLTLDRKKIDIVK